MKQLELTPRLFAAAQLVPHGAAVADIGTDHAYLPVWLLKQGRARCTIAADLRTGPLDRARLTAKEYDCRENIDFRLCDGLADIRPDEVDCIVIAGMGGETIAAILQAAPWIQDAHYTLILQPMSAQNDLRRWLWQQGFSIESEQVVSEGDKIYTLIKARFGAATPMTLGEEWVGRQTPELDQPLRGELFRRLLDKTARAIDGISRGKGEDSRARLDELKQLQAELTQMKQEWEQWHR